MFKDKIFLEKGNRLMAEFDNAYYTITYIYCMTESGEQGSRVYGM